MEGVRVIEGDCLQVLPTLADQSVDAVVTDPPYPCINRPYGTWTEAEWWELMMGVCREARRVLKPAGSAVFVLQPNSRKVGSMRGWLWDFMAWACREWNVVQDAYWWNTSAMPVGGANVAGLMRPSCKLCVWLGPDDCWRDQAAVLLDESAANQRDRRNKDFADKECPSRRRTPTEGPRDDMERLRTAVERRGGTTPFNVLPIGSDGRWSGGTHGHGASTPMRLLRYWVRYVCPRGGTVLDPFGGSGTTAVVAAQEGRNAVIVERFPAYVATIRARLAALDAEAPLFAQQPLP